jgi:hypothetical protein
MAARSADRVTTIKVAGGVYQTNTFCDVYYHRTVGINGDCKDRPDIVLAGKDIAFQALDTVILVIRCVDIRSSGAESTAFASRQFAIIDVDNVRIGQLAGGTVMRAWETSRINCISGLVLYGSVSHVAQAVGMSTGRPQLRIQFREHATRERDRSCSTKVLDRREWRFLGWRFRW